MPTPTPVIARPARALYLDAFRGFTVAGMLLVNNASFSAGVPAQLVHAPWNQGVTFADMIFPWFLMAMGMAIPFSQASERARGTPRLRLVWRSVRRALVLLALGWLVDSAVAGHIVIGLGVLQLLGLTYLAAVALAGLPARARLVIAFVLLGAHWAAIRFLPVPEIGAGGFEEGRNLIQYLNQTYLARYHISGLISVVPTSALVLIATALTDVLRRMDLRLWRRFATMLLAGVGLTAGGWLLNLDLPFNKPVWTASYILLSAGLGTIIVAGFYLVFELAGWRWMALPLLVFGANPIVAYVAPILVKVMVLKHWTHIVAGRAVTLERAAQLWLGQVVGSAGAGTAYTVLYIGFWWLLCAYLYRRRIFVRI